MKRATFVCVLGLALASACDGIGREVVDHSDLPPIGTFSTVCEPASCDGPIRDRELAPSLTTRLSDPVLAECGGVVDSCALAPSTGNADPRVCAAGALTEPAQLANQRLNCADVELALPVVQGECSFTVAGVELERSTLRVHAGGSCAVALPALKARQARIELVGPIVLIVEQRAVIEDVSFVGERSAAGAPQLELDLIEGARVVVGDEALPFEGALRARHTSLTDSSIRAEEVGLESVLFYNAKLHAQDVDADDAVFEEAVIEVDGAVLSASVLKRADLRVCGPLLIAGGSLSHVVMRPCSEDLIRIYTSVISSSWLDGWIESDASSFEGVRFGSGAPTDFVQFGGSLYKTAFCAQARSYRVGDGAGATCMRCDDPGAFQPGGACSVSETSVIAADRTDCPAFQGLRVCLPHEIVESHRPRTAPSEQ